MAESVTEFHPGQLSDTTSHMLMVLAHLQTLAALSQMDLLRGDPFDLELSNSWQTLTEFSTETTKRMWDAVNAWRLRQITHEQCLNHLQILSAGIAAVMSMTRTIPDIEMEMKGAWQQVSGVAF